MVGWHVLLEQPLRCPLPDAFPYLFVSFLKFL